MEPASIIGIIGTVLSVADVVARSIKKLSDIKTRYRNAPLQASTLIGQLYIIKAALDELSSWKLADLEHNPRFKQLSFQINASLDCFEPLMLALQRYLVAFEVQEVSDLTTSQRISIVWNEKELSGFLELLDRQVNALNLFLQIVQCKTWMEQQRMVTADDNQTVLRLAEECKSFMSSDGISVLSEDTNAISLEFEFDALVLGSRVYQTAHRSHLRQMIRGEQQADAQTIAENVLGETFTNKVPRLSTSSQSDELSVRRKDDRDKSDQRVLASFVPELVSRTDNIPRSRGISLGAVRDVLRKRAQKPTKDEQASAKLPVDLDGETTSRLQPVKGATVLLLGLWGCGKSTLLKSFRLHLTPGFDTEERQRNRRIIWRSIMLHIMYAYDRYDIGNEEHAKFQLAENLRIVERRYQEDLDDQIFLTSGVLETIAAIWSHENFRKICGRKGDTPFADFDRPGFIMDNLGRLLSPEYIPSNEDMLRSRTRTKGFTETAFVTGDNHTLRVMDVGGARSERKKWVHLFREAGIVFLIDSTAYCRDTSDHVASNDMPEHEMLFEALVASEWFKQRPFLVIFTKVDLLEECIQLWPLHHYFKDYQQPDSVDPKEIVAAYLTYLENHFRKLIPPGRKIPVEFLKCNLITAHTDGTTQKIIEQVIEGHKRCGESKG